MLTAAAAIMGGLMVATALTLLSLPALYAAFFRVKRDEGKARMKKPCTMQGFFLAN